MLYNEARKESLQLMSKLAPRLIALEKPEVVELTPEEKNALHTDIDRLQEALHWIGFRMINGEAIMPVQKTRYTDHHWRTVSIAIAAFLLILLLGLHAGCGPASLELKQNSLTRDFTGLYTVTLTLKGQVVHRAQEALDQYLLETSTRLGCTPSNARIMSVSESASNHEVVDADGEQHTRTHASTVVNAAFNCISKPAS